MLIDMKTGLKQQEIKELNWQLDLLIAFYRSNFPNKLEICKVSIFFIIII